MISRSLSALLLCAVLAAVATSQTPAKDKESPGGSKEVAGKSLQDWVKMSSNPDPAVREQAVAVLANFAVDIKKDREISRYLLNRLDKQENDSTVRIALIDLAGAMELEDPDDPKEAPRILTKWAVDGVSALRLHSLEALGRYGPKAYGFIEALNVDKVMRDTSYQIRVAVAQVLGRIGHNDAGPSPIALSILSMTLSKDISAPVRLSALQSLFALGPPLKNGSDVSKKILDEMKGRIGAMKGATASENDRQIELWCRLVIIKFGGDLDEQLNAIAQHMTDKEIAVRLQAVEVLGLVGEAAAPKLDVV
jgi:HEAT repeat protein